MRVVSHADARAFLERARAWLEEAEDENNLVLGIAQERAAHPAPEGPEGLEAPWFATVEDAGEVRGCTFRTPPHKVVLTRMSLEAAAMVASEAAERFKETPGFMGPRDVTGAAAREWVARRGGTASPGMEMRLYRLEAVTPPEGVPGEIRLAGEADLDLVRVWSDGFARDAGAVIATTDEARREFVAGRHLWLWDDGEPVCMAVTRGRTRRGIRVGYVYTPPERRARGYASALVAAVSQRMLDQGLSFCVLYTDLSNPTSNGIYQRVGYRPVSDVVDVLIQADPQT